MKIAVFGAGGFVGSTLCERLHFEREFEFVPIIHSYGGAGRLARLPLEFRVASALDESRLLEALAGCDTVVNCSRGDGIVMLNGLKVLIRAARRAGIKRLVHISSISIYGSSPDMAAATEAAPARPDDAYGVWKAKQDDMLFSTHGSGLEVVMFCPGNIYGPYSAFIAGAADYARSQPVFLVDDGQHPTNNVHVNNVVEGILSALRSERGWGQRYFVNEVERWNWRTFYDEMCRIVGVTPEYISVPREQVVEALKAAVPDKARVGVVGHLKIAASGEFRKGLAMLPAFSAVNDFVYRQVSRLDPRTQDRLRARVQRPTHIAKQHAGTRLDGKYIRAQIRTVYHSPKKAIDELGFRPFSTRKGMQTVESWLQFTSGRSPWP
jgi:nucleoside-diphosphate-sugar epimerase